VRWDLLDDLAGIHHTDRSHSERMMPRLWAISSTAALLSFAQTRHQIEHL
jgi:hypothetical protein